jgi:hypothetical protein
MSVSTFGSSRRGRWGGGWLFGWAFALAFALLFPQITTAAPPPPPPPAKAKPAAPVAATPAKPTPAKPTAAKPTAAAPATPTKPAAPPKAPDPKPADPASDPSVRQSEVYGDRIDGLAVEVDDLKDKIFRSKARLALLRETVLKGVMAGSRVVIAHRNLMGSGFRLVKMVYVMDGAQIYARSDESGSLDSEDELIIYDGNLPPGPHNVTIELTYKGHGYGVFAYLSGYTFDSRSSHSFTAPENGAVKLSSVGYERGNMTTEMRERPHVNWQELPLDAAGRPLAQPKSRRVKDGE